MVEEAATFFCVGAAATAGLGGRGTGTVMAGVVGLADADEVGLEGGGVAVVAVVAVVGGEGVAGGGVVLAVEEDVVDGRGETCLKLAISWRFQVVPSLHVTLIFQCPALFSGAVLTTPVFPWCSLLDPQYSTTSPTRNASLMSTSNEACDDDEAEEAAGPVADAPPADDAGLLVVLLVLVVVVVLVVLEVLRLLEAVLVLPPLIKAVVGGG